MSNIKQISTFVNKDSIKNKFTEVLGKNAGSFLSSALTVLSQNDKLSMSTEESVYTAMLTAATLNLPLNPSLGFAYLVPFNNRKKGVQECQFQIGYKGLIQLAMRSGQFKTISAAPIFEGQLISSNPLTGFEFDFSVESNGNPIGYAAYFSLTNGFEKTLYIDKKTIDKHGKKYSQTYKSGFGLWKDDFEAMALKTVLKLLLGKYAPMSIEMQRAVISDQAVIKDVETMDVDYIDNTTLTIAEKQKEQDKESALKFILEAPTMDSLQEVQEEALKLGLENEYNTRKEVLNAGV